MKAVRHQSGRPWITASRRARGRVAVLSGTSRAEAEARLLAEPVTSSSTLSTGYGTVTFDGGTGQFTHFHAAQIDVTPLGFPNWAWDGSYSFSPGD